MKIAILGFGREGKSLLNYLNRAPKYRGAEIWILDKNEDVKIPPGVYARLGRYYLHGLHEFDIAFRSPGVPYRAPEILRAEKKGVVISSPTKLFFEEATARGVHIVGVTGTKGKGTTSTLTYEILKHAGLDVFLAGNIGLPATDILPKLRRNSWAVLELSSFQLIDLKASPHIAVALMITSEHMDWHRDLKEYIAAKANIVRSQSLEDYAVIADEYPRSKGFAKLTRAHVFFYSKQKKVKKGTWAEDGAFWFSDGKKQEKICAVSDLWIPGFHNLDNTCAAITVAKIAGVKNSAIRTAIREFRGLDHRIQLVAEVRGVRYYDDSYSTVPETAVVALQAFTAPKTLILGGSSKNSDFRNLGKIISQSKSVKAIIGVGIEWPQIKARIQNREKRIEIIEGCKNMRAIIRAAAKVSAPGDVVLLSPACASFGMFKNYTDRGDQFKKYVKELTKK